MTTHTFNCNNCHEPIVKEASLSAGPPDMTEVICPHCGTHGRWTKVWVANNVVWKATGFSKTAELDLQRARGEYVVDRK